MSGLEDIAAEAINALLGLPLVGLGLRMLALYLTILWVASAWWTWRDARARTRDPLVPYIAAGAVIVTTPLLFLLAVVAYRVLRPPLTVAEQEASQLQLVMLEEEAARPECRRCGIPVLEEWVACPRCGTELAVRCLGCGRPLELDWEICAWCASEVPWAAEPVGGPGPRRAPVREPVAIPILPGGRPLLPVMAAPDESQDHVVSQAPSRETPRGEEQPVGGRHTTPRSPAGGAGKAGEVASRARPRRPSAGL